MFFLRCSNFILQELPLQTNLSLAFLLCLVSLELKGGNSSCCSDCLETCVAACEILCLVLESSSAFFFVSELDWMAGDSDYCVSSAHTRLLSYELEPLLHDLNASTSILLFRIYLATKVYFVARLSICADTEIMC